MAQLGQRLEKEAVLLLNLALLPGDVKREPNGAVGGVGLLAGGRLGGKGGCEQLARLQYTLRFVQAQEHHGQGSCMDFSDAQGGGAGALGALYLPDAVLL